MGEHYEVLKRLFVGRRLVVVVAFLSDVGHYHRLYFKEVIFGEIFVENAKLGQRSEKLGPLQFIKFMAKLKLR